MKKIFYIIFLLFISAIILFPKDESNNSGNTIYNLMMGYYYKTNYNYDSAAAIFNSIAVSSDTALNNEAEKELITLYEETGDFDSALFYITKLINSDSDNFFPYFHSGIINLKNGNYETAKENIEKAYKLNPTDKKILFYLGSIYYATNNYDSAIYYYNSFLNYNPPNIDILFNLGKLYYLKNQFDTSILYLKEVIDIKPYFLDAYSILANAYLQTGNKEEAMTTFEDLIKIDPDNKMAVTKVMENYSDKKKFDKMKELIMYLMKQNSINLNDLARYAILLIKNGDLDFALDVLNYILSVQPEFIEGYVYIGYIFEQKLMFSEAIKYYENALEINPNNIEIYFLIGDVYELINDYKKAYEIYQDVLEIDKNNFKAIFKCGVVQEKLKNFEKAEEFLLKAISLNPEDATVLNYLGYLYAERNIKIAEAKKFIEKALSLQPKNGYYLDSLSWIYFQQNDFQKAYELIKESMKYSDDDPIIFEHYGDISLKLNKVDEAIEAYKKSLELKENENIKKKLLEIKK